MAGLLKKIKIGLESKASDSISEVVQCQEGIRKKKSRNLRGLAGIAHDEDGAGDRPASFHDLCRSVNAIGAAA